MTIRPLKNTTTSETQENPFRILALGDSYTIGEGVAESQGWPAQLRRVLQRMGILVRKNVIIAQTGWTTRDLRTAIEKNKPTGPFDLVTLLIGVNNQYQGLDIETYQTEFRGLLKLAARYTGGAPSKILVLSIPDWGQTPFNKDCDQIYISAEIDQFNQVNLKDLRRSGVNISILHRSLARQPATSRC